jgi:hypothetical protein
MARTLVAPGAAALAAFGAAAAARWMLAPSAAVAGLLLCGVFAAPAALLALYGTRSGRRALQDALRSLADLRRPSPPAPLPSAEQENQDPLRQPVHLRE